MTAREKPAPLTQAEVDALPDGAEIIVTWSGGNGPHRYTVTVDEHGRRAVFCHAALVGLLERVGPAPLTHVSLASAEKRLRKAGA